MKVYISGPMTGYEDLNRPAFHDVARALRTLGHVVVSPVEIEHVGDYDDWLKADLAEMLRCDEVVTLDGWESSRGARLEVTTAIQVGMRVRPWRTVASFGSL